MARNGTGTYRFGATGKIPVLAGARRRHQSSPGTLSERADGEVRELLVSLRVLACAVFAVLASAAPAQAQLETAPTVIPFEDGHTPPVRSGAGAVLRSDCGDRTVASGGRDGGTYLVLGCPFTFLSFSEPQAMVEFFVRMPAGETWVFRACAAAAVLDRVPAGGRQRRVDAGGPGRPRRQRDDPQVVRETLTSGGPLELDDVAFSPVRQPGTAISGVDPVRRGRAGDYDLLSSGVAPTAFACSLDGAAFAPCSTPYTATGTRGRCAHAGRDVRSTRMAPATHAGSGRVQRGVVRHRRRRPAQIRPTTARASPTATRPTVTPTASATPASGSRPATSRQSRASTRSFARSPARCS